MAVSVAANAFRTRRASLAGNLRIRHRTRCRTVQYGLRLIIQQEQNPGQIAKLRSSIMDDRRYDDFLSLSLSLALPLWISVVVDSWKLVAVKMSQALLRFN